MQAATVDTRMSDVIALDSPVRKRLAAELALAVAPHVERGEATGVVPPDSVDALVDLGYFALPGSEPHGKTWLEHGLAYEELGRVWASAASIVTAHTMASAAIARWGQETVRAEAASRRLLSFALSEDSVGSDAGAVTTAARTEGDTVVLSGCKTWVTGGAAADAFLVIARAEEGPLAVLVPREAPGVRVVPLSPLLGFRAGMLARLELSDCKVSSSHTVARPGMGFNQVAATALDHGRHCISWLSVGMAQACVDASVAHAATRTQFGRPILEHQLVGRLVSDMVVGTTSARLLCAESARHRDTRSPDAVVLTTMAKYLAASTAARVSRDAVQLHGALGCVVGTVVERAFRDAKIVEIIEGSTEIQQITIAERAWLFTSPCGQP
jgi:alkylation response protein AidB-like acyl-CoA dehydrogenase